MYTIEERISALEHRNRRVELDKSWESSFTRKACLIVFTYLIVGFYMQAINIAQAWLNASIPALGFFLSTLTLPIFKKLWAKYIYQDKN